MHKEFQTSLDYIENNMPHKTMMFIYILPLKTEFPSVAHTDLEIPMLLSLPLEFCDYRHVPPYQLILTTLFKMYTAHLREVPL